MTKSVGINIGKIMMRTLAIKVVDFLEKHTGFVLRERLSAIEKTFYRSPSINVIRRAIDSTMIALRALLGLHPKPLRLHLGCGEMRRDGFINVDLNKSRATDYVCDIRKIPFRRNSVDEIVTFHVIEHIPRRYVEKVIRKWFSILKPGGKLTIECPDFDGAIKEYLDGNKDRIDNIFGLQRFEGDTHYFGYNFERIATLLKDVGFGNVTRVTPQDYHVDLEPCMRVEAVKPE